MKRLLRSRLIRTIATLVMIVGAIALPLSSSIVRSHAASARAPLLQLPWPTGQQHDISGGFTYNCGDHGPPPPTGNPLDYYAIDFALPLDSKVSAVASGIAHIVSDNGNGYGNYSWIQHANNYVSLYAHLDTFKIADGQTVKQGQVIALSGSTGHSTGPHLHFSLRSGATSDTDGTAFMPEPMSGYTGFGQYGYCTNTLTSPMYTSSKPTQAWQIDSSPNTGSSSGLSGVVAINAYDVWAVGSILGSTLAEHWNGSSWSVIPTQNPGGEDFLSAVAAISTNDVWAVGYYNNNNQGYQTLTEHWDGNSWSVVPSPNSGSGGNGNYLLGIAAISTVDVWAVGEDDNIGKALIEHWDGTSWSIVSSPTIGFYSSLLGITAISASNIWAVGTYTDNSSGNQSTLTEHWDGNGWSVVSSPNPPNSQYPVHNFLAGATALSSKNVWVVGWVTDPGNTSLQTLTEHWNGTSWSIVSSPNVGTTNMRLYSVAAMAANNIWAVGFYYDNTGHPQSLIEQWNGSSWSVTSSPGSNNVLVGITVVRANSTAQWDIAWSVGTSPTSSLVEFRD